MPRRRPRPDNEGGPLLRDIRLPVIEVVCVPCGRHDLLERRALVEKFGAGISFSRLRRRWQWDVSVFAIRAAINAARDFPVSMAKADL